MLFRRNSWNGTSRAPAAGRCRLALLSACLGAGASLLAQQPPPDTHTLRVDGAPQAVTHFLPTHAPIRIALLVEASPAVFLIRYDHLAAAHFLLAGLRPDDEAALVTYARAPRPELGFTRDKAEVERQLDRRGQFGLGMADVRLLDAVAQTLDWLSPPPARTAVVVIGTGLDSGSRTDWEALEQRIGSSP